MAINTDFAPTFMDIASVCRPLRTCRASGLVPPSEKEKPHGLADELLLSLLRHDPGDHNTRAHYGVRTMTHKLIYFWKKNQWEMYDLSTDPDELHNLYNDPGQQQTVAGLKAEMYRLKKEVKDDDQYANQQPPPGSD